MYMSITVVAGPFGGAVTHSGREGDVDPHLRQVRDAHDVTGSVAPVRDGEDVTRPRAPSRVAKGPLGSGPACN